MKKMNKKIESSIKIIVLACILLTPISLSAEMNDKEWTKICNKKKECLVGIKKEISVPNSDKKQTLATIFIRIGSSVEKKMTLVDGEEETYKIKEEKTSVPVLFVQLPFNSDLQKNPLISIGKQKIANLKFTHCNPSVGCSTNISLNDEAIKFFKEGKELTVTMVIFGDSKNTTFNFPLKEFTKSYKSLLK